MQIVELEMVPLSLRPVLQRLYDMKTTQSALREGVLFSTKRNNYYYDTGTGKVIVLDDDTSYIFRVLFDPTLSAETFLISLTKVDPNAVKNLLQTIDAERLFQRPPLLSMGKEIAAGVTDTEQKVEQIILEVTEQCNFRCKYCVYSEDFSGNRDFGNRRMPTEIAFKAIDWALENSGAKLAITFYGGEPLLNFKLMKAVIERSQAKRGNKEIVYILYWETARSLWTQYLKAIPGKEEKAKRAIRGILADYEKEERDIIYLESKNHCVLVHLDGIRQTPEGSPSFYATLDEAEHEFASSAFLRIHKSYLINGDHILQMSNYKVLLDTGMTLKGSRKYFSKAKLEFYRGR